MIGESFEFDSIIPPIRRDETSIPMNPSDVLEEAKRIRKIPVEIILNHDLGRQSGLKVARGIWTPFDINQKMLYQVPATIYFTDDGSMKVDDNMD